MSEKIDRRWRINSRAVLEVLYEGRWETAGTHWTHPDNGHNQRFRDLVADVCGEIDALTSERDAAVRIARDLLDEAGYCRHEESRPNYCMGHYRRLPCAIGEAREALDSLTATGGLEPQKGITE